MIHVYAKTWPMCAASLGFFVAVAALVYWLRAPRLGREIPRRLVFWVCAASWLLVSGVCLTLIDKPHLDLSPETKEWLFMFSAFLGIPLTVPLLAGAVWALARPRVLLPELVVLCVGTFALGCAASNLHDVVWCGIITHGYTQHYKAGYDLDLFVAFGKWFGIPREITADYLTLGPYTMVLICGELLVALAALLRFKQPCANGAAR